MARVEPSGFDEGEPQGISHHSFERPACIENG
jgi:hypothetical protein